MVTTDKDEKCKQITQLEKVYNPHRVEDKWYQFWLDQGLFRAEVAPEREPFTIVIPPPNVTGSLHMGHALDNTIQDILIRWKRMSGYEACWVPGMDHAGIGTQTKVEENLAEEGLSRHDLGREEFLSRTWEWKEKYGGEILNQLRRLGASCDWSRERFTMDEGCSKAVREAFFSLYEKGLIYQGNYIINWCPRCSTALSDLEVEHQEGPGKLYHVNYPFADGGGYITVATTRPETILGDTAVAVHPDDERYTEMVGREVILPEIGRRIPIIADSYVDPEFGSGMVKVTPAHDPNDFEMGMRHQLEAIRVIGDDGIMTNMAGRYEGMDRHECREALLKALDQEGLLVKVEEHTHAVGHCDRCDTVVEPLISKQWFVKMKPLAEPAIEAVHSGDIRFVPERFAKIYTNWMENIRDWCISRQIWWGHRIPVWYCQDCGEVIVSREDPDSCGKCNSDRLEQDTDVLDTWFSSALWPFEVFGWPEETSDLEYFYPTTVLVTAYDIIFFWVARMIFSGLEHVDEKPFDDVLIHGLIRAEDGRKMSKSLGNGVDPLEVIDEYGADTLRFALLTGVTPGNDTRYKGEKVEAARNFCNKIWNAARFSLMNLEDFGAEEAGWALADIRNRGIELETADRWILSRLEEAKAEINRMLDAYDLGGATHILYEFIWSEFCDWYIEAIKPRLYGKVGKDDAEKQQRRRAAQWALAKVLEETMRLLHPFMPFITEEIWQHLPGTGESIVRAQWPEPDASLVDRAAVSAMEQTMETVRTIRNLRAQMNIPPSQGIPAIVSPASEEDNSIFQAVEGDVTNLARVSELTVAMGGSKPDKALAAVVKGAELYLPLADVIDFDSEITRLEKELGQMEQEIKRARGKLANESFVDKAPAEVVQKERAKLEDYRERASSLQVLLKDLQS